MRRPAGPSTSLAFTAGLLCASLLVPTAGCAWGYAGQPDDDSATDSDSRSSSDEDPNVVVQKDEDQEESAPESGDEAEGSETTTEGPSAGETGSGADQKSTSPCGVETFEIHYYDQSTQITKVIECASRTVVSVKESPISQQKLTSADQSGLPEETWYVLVDPKGLRGEFLDNDELIRISQEYDLQFLGRDEQRNLLIYQFRGNL